MLLVIGYDMKDVERVRFLFRKYGFPTYGCTCRQLSDFPYVEDVTALYFPRPLSARRTDYVVRPFCAAHPDVSVFLSLHDGFRQEEAEKCLCHAEILPAGRRNTRLVRYFRGAGVLYPRYAAAGGVYRHTLNDTILLFGDPFPLTAEENTVLAFLILHPDGVSSEHIYAACLPLGKKNRASSPISRINAKARDQHGRSIIQYVRHKGYAFFG